VASLAKAGVFEGMGKVALWQDYADQLIDLIRKGNCDAIAPSMAALEDYEARRTEAAKRTVFASGCSSWYLDKDGVPQVWPWSYDYFRAVMAKPDLGDYEMMQGQ
jgi:hypothetical protein